MRLLGSAFPGKMFADMHAIEYTRTFTDDEWSALQHGATAQSMEDKWDIVHRDDDEYHVFFARSWSQRIVFILPLDPNGSRTVTQFFVRNDLPDEIALNVNPPPWTSPIGSTSSWTMCSSSARRPSHSCSAPNSP